MTKANKSQDRDVGYFEVKDKWSYHGGTHALWKILLSILTRNISELSSLFEFHHQQKRRQFFNADSSPTMDPRRPHTQREPPRGFGCASTRSPFCASPSPPKYVWAILRGPSTVRRDNNSFYLVPLFSRIYIVTVYRVPRRWKLTNVLNYERIVTIFAIGVSHTACKDEFRRNLRSHSWSVFLFL